jgi:hypothetical protein
MDDSNRLLHHLSYFVFNPHSIRFIPGTHRIGAWVSHRPGLDVLQNRKISCLCRHSNPGSSYYTDYAMLTPLLALSKSNTEPGELPA